MYWRIAVALLCVGGLLALFNADLGPEDSPWDLVAGIGGPLLAG